MSSSEPISFQLKLEGPLEFFSNFYLIQRGPEVEKSGYKFQLVRYIYNGRSGRKASDKQVEGVLLRCHRVPSDFRISGWTLHAAVLTSAEWISIRFNKHITEVIVDRNDGDLEPNYTRQVRIDHVKVNKQYNWSKPSHDIHTDVCLVVGKGRKFYSCKATLATFCDLFRGMFLLNFKEAKMDRCDINIINARELQELLDVLYHKVDIDARNVLLLLKLNDVVGMPEIKARCFRVLAQLKDSEVPLSSRILLADQFFSLNDLLEVTLKPLTKPAEVQKAIPEDLESLSSSTRLRLLKKLRESVNPIPQPPLSHRRGPIDVEIGEISEQLRTDVSMANVERLTNAVIVIGDKEFHVCKEFLASHSTYFEKKFYSSDKNVDHFIIDTPISASQFQELLWLLYHEVDINERNLSGLLETSRFFKCEDIKEICMDYLISNDKLTIVKKIEMAERLNHWFVLDTLLDKLVHSPVLSSEIMKSFCPDTKDRLLDKFGESCPVHRPIGQTGANSQQSPYGALE